MESSRKDRINILKSEIKDQLEQKAELLKMDKDTSSLDSELWEKSKEVYTLKAQEKGDLKFEGLIFTVGLTPKPIILNILAVRPRYVYFICTHKSREQLNRIKRETGLEEDQFKVVIMEKDTMYRSFSLVKVGLQYLHEQNGVEYDKIAMDITGGTKMMSAGCGIAASKFNIDILYASNDQYDPDKRVPTPGTEKILVIPNPVKTEQIKAVKPDNTISIEPVTIFISYATKDTDLFKIRHIAELLAKYEEIQDVIYWEEHMTENMIKFMSRWVGQCDVLILFCSENTLHSIPVTKEWTAGDAINKPIIPIFYDVEHIPPLLRSRLGVEFDFYDIESNAHEMFSRIIKTCKARKSV